MQSPNSAVLVSLVPLLQRLLVWSVVEVERAVEAAEPVASVVSLVDSGDRVQTHLNHKTVAAPVDTSLEKHGGSLREQRDRRKGSPKGVFEEKLTEQLT
mmetsp:Transcript_6675/g.20219  ORF Transcript_6675/g.20219 Transcript_6675/m.20219 type:complete len:99 (+) Transcript_6675:360-656(+)